MTSNLRPRNRGWRTAMVSALAGLALVTTACSASQNAVDQTAGSQFRYTSATVQGSIVPAADRRRPGKVSGELLGGRGTYALSQDLGKVVVINLWGSWCAPCRVETPEFQQVYLQTKAQGVDFVGFAVKETSPSNTQDFVSAYQVTYPIVYDPMTKVALQLGNLRVAAGLPQTVLIDRQGRVAAVYIGQVQPSKLKPALAQLIAES